MGITISVLLLAVGAVLTFAVEAEVTFVELGTVGVILMIVGAIGLVWSLFAAETLGRRDRVVEQPTDRVVERR